MWQAYGRQINIGIIAVGHSEVKNNKNKNPDKINSFQSRTGMADSVGGPTMSAHVTGTGVDNLWKPTVFTDTQGLTLSLLWK